MKLIIELTAFQRGSSYGFEEYVCNLLRYMTAHVDEINAEEKVITCRESQVDYFTTLTKGTFDVIGVTADSRFDRFIASIRAIKKTKVEKKDIVLFPCNSMPLWPLKGKKLLVVHDLLFRHGEFCAKTLKFCLFRLNLFVHMPLSLKKANRIIAISDYAKNEMTHFYHVPSDKISVVYNYFDFGKFSMPGQEMALFDIDSDYFMSVCSRVKHKNHITILRAFNKLAEQDKMIKYVFVGGLNNEAQEYYDAMPTDIRRRVLFFEHLSNAALGKLYQNTKAFVSASLYEGLGMPVVEAMYFNCPVILSDLSVHREVSLNQGNYFSPTDADELYDKMTHVDSSRKCYSKEIESIYSERNTSARYVAEINRLGGVNLQFRICVSGLNVDYTHAVWCEKRRAA